MENNDVSNEAPASYYYSEGVAGSGDAPDWFKADKYKTVSDQAKAYKELESKYGEMSNKIKNFDGAPEAYNVQLPEGVQITEDDPMLSKAQEWAKDVNMSQDGFNSLVNMYAEMKTAEKQAMEDAWNESRSNIENFDARSKNISDFLSANKLDALAEVIATEEELNAFEKLLDMAGNANIDPGSGEGDSMPTQEEIDKLMFEKDEFGRQIYGYDKERQAKVRKMLERRVGSGVSQQFVG